MKEGIVISEPTQEQIDRSMDISDELVELVYEVAGEESADRDADEIGVLYGIWVHMLHALFSAGWTVDDLVKDVRSHGTDEEMPTMGSC